jgi:hypothetical protein
LKQLRHSGYLDVILGMVLRFDEIAKQLAPGRTALQLRCAALNLRKTHRLGPTRGKTVPDFDLVPAGPLKSIIIPEIPRFPATYVFYDSNRPIFAGETEDLRKRVEMHVTSGLPRWLTDPGEFDLILKHSVQPVTKQEERRIWLGQFINRERPLLNYQKVA